MKSPDLVLVQNIYRVYTSFFTLTKLITLLFKVYTDNLMQTINTTRLENIEKVKQ